MLRRGAEKLGIVTGPVPLLINSVPFGGRARCVQCGECVGFPCPTDAKNGTFNTTIARALATGNCALVANARAEHLVTDQRGRVIGACLVDMRSGTRRELRATHVVVAGGAIESARLLLVSRSAASPDGIGNATGQVGRHLQGHLYAGAFGLFDEPIHDSHGPGVSIATCDYVNDEDSGVIGSGVLANEVVKLPILFWYWALPPDAPRRGLAGKRVMRENYRRTSHLFGPIQEVPMPDARVTLADDVRDRDGNAVARLEGQLHAESLRAAAWMRDRAEEWLDASGATRVWGIPITNTLTAGQHQAGTCRMGDDPAPSVCDPWGRVHGHDNVWVMDGSLHVTNGGVNPVLTILALAFRNAEHLARQ